MFSKNILVAPSSNPENTENLKAWVLSRRPQMQDISKDEFIDAMAYLAHLEAHALGGVALFEFMEPLKEIVLYVMQTHALDLDQIKVPWGAQNRNEISIAALLNECDSSQYLDPWVKFGLIGWSGWSLASSYDGRKVYKFGQNQGSLASAIMHHICGPLLVEDGDALVWLKSVQDNTLPYKQIPSTMKGAAMWLLRDHAKKRAELIQVFKHDRFKPDITEGIEQALVWITKLGQSDLKPKFESDVFPLVESALMEFVNHLAAPPLIEKVLHQVADFKQCLEQKHKAQRWLSVAQGLLKHEQDDPDIMKYVLAGVIEQCPQALRLWNLDSGPLSGSLFTQACQELAFDLALYLLDRGHASPWVNLDGELKLPWDSTFRGAQLNESNPFRNCMLAVTNFEMPLASIVLKKLSQLYLETLIECGHTAQQARLEVEQAWTAYLPRAADLQCPPLEQIEKVVLDQKLALDDYLRETSDPHFKHERKASAAPRL